MGFAKKATRPLVAFAYLMFLLPAVALSLMGPAQGAVKERIADQRDAHATGLPKPALLHQVAGRVGGAMKTGQERPGTSGGHSTWSQPGSEKPLSAVAFPSWSAAIRRHNVVESKAADLCNESNEGPCRLLPWQSFLDGLRGLAPMEQITQVNRYINKLRYRSDQALWGKVDYWAAPDEFLANGGDCEDFAVAKYYSLKRLGFSPEAMRIVVLNDVRRGQVHAVLAVQLDGREVVLDNLHNKVLTWQQARHYEPIYSVNERRSWLHAGLAQTKSKPAGG